GYVMTRLKTELYEQGILTHCQRSCTLRHSCCMGLEPLSESADSFYHVFLPSVVDTLLSLAAHLDKRAECVSVFRCIMDSLHWLLSSHDTLCSQGQFIGPDVVCAGLDSLLDKDWRGQGFDQDLDQLIGFIQSEPGVRSQSRVQAACVIQAFWRSYQTRRRIKGLNKAVSSLQRRYRFVSVSYCLVVCVFMFLTRCVCACVDQVQSYLQQCEIRAALIIQSCWRGVRARRQYSVALKEARRREVAARTLQRAVRRFLQKCQAVKVPPLPPLWIGQEGLTDSRRAELRQELLTVATTETLPYSDPPLLAPPLYFKSPSSTDAPPLSVATATDAESFLSPSVSISAVARQAHKAALLANQLPWWRSGDWVEQPHDSAHRQELELEVDFGGLYVGGATVGILKQ
uniref:IQ motif containing B1 n=1 Tax=Gouania willdenowi TaxID=441366 RepID=A0A8C5DE65_GOUWI